MQKIKSGFSKLLNPLIGDILFRSAFIEAWAREIKGIIGNCMNAGDPAPAFECDEYDFQVTFRFPNSMKPMIQQGSRTVKF